MSDISRNASNESPASAAAPLPIIHATPPDIAIEVDPEEVYPLHSSPEPTPVPPPTDEARVTFPDPPSPRSGLSILQVFGTGGSVENIREAAQDVARTFTKRVQDYEQIVADLRRENAHKKDTVAHLHRQIREIRAQRPQMPPPPPGFVENDGRLPDFYIPFKGSRARARYVRTSLSEGLHAEGTMGGEDAEIYTTTLKALPAIPPGDTSPPEPLPEWFLNLLYATEANFGVLLAGARELDDWGLTADLACYRGNSDRINSLYAAREGIDASIAACRGVQDLALHRLCAARAADRLRHFQRLGDPMGDLSGEVRPRDDAPHRPQASRRARGRAPL